MLLFRPHHFMCSLGYEGKGYSKAFVENYNKIIQILRGNEGDETLIKVAKHTDDICAPCPKKNEHLCQNQEKIENLDQKHLKALGLHFDETIRWKEAKNRIKEKISLETFHSICAGCEWKDLGLCEKALKNLLDSR